MTQFTLVAGHPGLYAPINGGHSSISLRSFHLSGHPSNSDQKLTLSRQITVFALPQTVGVLLKANVQH